MKSPILILLAMASLLADSCSQGQNETSLSAMEFSRRIEQSPRAVVLDVRTPEEYAEGHLAKSMNLNWKGSDFEKQIATIDKTVPVFVYCLGGGRSASAATRMRSKGFKEVYELQGGLTKWKDAKLPTIR